MANQLHSIMSTARSALLNQQLAINVTGHNIANANTEGYSRQSVTLETSPPVTCSPGQLGTGVKACEIQRSYDRYTVAQLNSETMGRGRWEAQSSLLQRVENVFDESDGYGLNQAMNEFWNAWQDLSNRPEGQAERLALLSKSDTLSDTFQQLHEDVNSVGMDADRNIQLSMTGINDVTGQIADLNRQIQAAEATGQNANDYRDKRDLLVNDLATMIDIQTHEDASGMVTVNTSTGRALVVGEKSWELTAETDPLNPGLHTVNWNDSDGNPLDITGEIASGKLKGWLEVRDELVPDYLGRLDDLATGLVAEVNALHSTGYGLVDSATGLPFQGNNFFDAAATGARDIALDAAVTAHPEAVAASATETGVPGDNANAIAIAELQNTLTMGGGATETFGEFYNALIADVGSEVQRSENGYNYQLSVETLLKNQRESISGVSMDEEMINLVKFQHAYESAAKLISTADEMMQTVLQMV